VSGPAQVVYAALAFPIVDRVVYGAFVWSRRALNSPKRRFSARAVRAELGYDDATEPGGFMPDVVRRTESGEGELAAVRQQSAVLRHELGEDLVVLGMLSAERPGPGGALEALTEAGAIARSAQTTAVAV
jgi:hypothetical protein